MILSGKKEEKAKAEENKLLREEVLRLKTSLKEMKKPKESPHPNSRGSLTAIEVQTEQAKPLEQERQRDPFVSIGTTNEERSLQKSPLKEFVIARPLKETLSVEEAIPAGTSIKAVLVSSIDAPCGVYSSGDPQPVKLRILDDGHLPKEVLARLKGGLIIASAYGDISTERVFMRLERLTLVQPSGEFVETAITGFVSGEDGKYGVRGTVIDKSSKLVTNAAYSGFFSGLGQFLNTTVIAGASNANCCG